MQLTAPRRLLEPGKERWTWPRLAEEVATVTELAPGSTASTALRDCFSDQGEAFKFYRYYI